VSVALVTGAAGGLGSAVAARLAEEHAVLLMDLDADRLVDVAARLAAGGAKVAHAAGDVSRRDSVQAAFAAAEEHLGEVELLANLAGVGMFHPFTELTEETWDRTFAVNARGTFLTCQELVRRRAGRPGAIVNIASVGAPMRASEWVSSMTAALEAP